MFVFDKSPWPIDREKVLECIEQGRDPLLEWDHSLDNTPFHEASKSRDLELLLHMAAESGTAWTKRFLFCRNREVEVPVKGRICIPALCSKNGDCFFFQDGISMEGLEVLKMYGYKLKSLDLECIYHLFASTDDRPQFHRLKVLKLCLATAGSNLATWKSDAWWDGMIFTLDFGLHLAITCVTSPELARVELVRVLLKAGANPNNPQFLSWPLLLHAIQGRQTNMVKLLIEYGAELPSVVQEERYNRDEGTIESVDISTLAVAEENGMLELILDRPSTPVVVNAHEYIHQLRLEITKPLRLAISGILVVAFMRTGKAPPVDIILSSILSFCDFWNHD
jgi:hypothetical protein